MYDTLKCQYISVILFLLFFGLWPKGCQCLVLFAKSIGGLCNCSPVSHFLAIIAIRLFKQIVNMDSGGTL